MVCHDVADVARALVDGMQSFLLGALPKTTPEHHRSTSPRDWSLLARAWTEAMQECHDDIWTPAIHEAWCRVMTLLLRSIYKQLWYKDADELHEKIEKKSAVVNENKQNNNDASTSSRRKVIVRRA